MARYIIIGAGAVGSTLAAEFTLAGIPAILVGRGAQAAHLQAHGLSYRRPDGQHQIALTVRDQSAPPGLLPGDVLIFAVKAQDIETVSAEWASRPVADGGIAADLPAVTLQNGLAAERAVARRFPKILAASILTPAIYTETGKVSVWAGPRVAVISIGRFPHGEDPVGAAIARDLERANALVELRPDIRRWKAAKLIHNVTNVLELFAGSEADTALAAKALSSEARRVLVAAGYDPAEPHERQISLEDWRVSYDPEQPRGRQSTWQSLMRGSGSEVDYLNGEIVALGLLHGVPTPWNSSAQRIAATIFAAEGSSPPVAELLRAAQGAGAEGEAVEA